MRRMNVLSNTGRKLLVLDLAPGEYGAHPGAADPSYRQVEFYDAGYDFTEYGQFISRYYVHTILEPSRAERLGLALDGNEPEWAISGTTFLAIRGWLEAS